MQGNQQATGNPALQAAAAAGRPAFLIRSVQGASLKGVQRGVAQQMVHPEA